MQLVPTVQHKAPGQIQELLHPFQSITGPTGGGGLSVIARLEGARATKIEGRRLEAGHERLTRRVPHLA